MANELRSRGRSAMKNFLSGGWKDESDKRWEASTEVETEREKRVQVLGALMKSLDGLRM